jgi:hypothetical protein
MKKGKVVFTAFPFKLKIIDLVRKPLSYSDEVKSFASHFAINEPDNEDCSLGLRHHISFFIDDIAFR